jgi:ferredoxin
MHRLRVCVPECPVDAIKPDTEPGLENWLSLNAEYAKIWPNITVKNAPKWEGEAGQTPILLTKSRRG